MSKDEIIESSVAKLVKKIQKIILNGIIFFTVGYFIYVENTKIFKLTAI